MKATEILKQEHENILSVLHCLEKEIEKMRRTGTVQTFKLSQIIDFFQNYADKLHHGKEEKELFTKLIENGMSREICPLAVMFAEHDMGREKIKTMKEAIGSMQNGNSDAFALLCTTMEEYIELLRDHIDKENCILFPMSDQILKAQDQEYLSQTFDKSQREDKAIYEKYHTLSQKLMDSK